MLRIVVQIGESFNEVTSEFVSTEEHTLDLEHSLASLSKWESKYEIPFLTSNEKTSEQILDYVRMMVLGENPPEEIFNNLSETNLESIARYISANMTATTINDSMSKKSQEIVTAELIYFWMIDHDIPFECQYWHLNRLLTLVRVCNIKNQQKNQSQNRNPMSRQDIMDRRALNAKRKAEFGTTG